jgi:multiple antibiotic resistance protein
MPATVLVDILKNCLVILSALFPIVNPLGSSPIFLSLTPGYSRAERTLLSGRIALNSYWLLTGSMLIGGQILKFFGISIPVVQVGGGLVVMFAGWNLLQAETADPTRDNAQKSITHHDIEDKAFYPLTLPLTVGPGSISVALTLGATQTPQRSMMVSIAAAIIGPALVALTIYFCYRSAERIARFFGDTAMNVIVRLSSFILLCIGVQIVWDGIRALILSTR